MTRTTVLVLALASIGLAQATETRIHDVSYLTMPVPDHPGDAMEAYDEGAVIDSGPVEWQPFSTEQIVELVKNQIEREKWDTDYGIQAFEGAICVRAPQDVQTAVAKLLESLAASIGPQVQVDVSRVRVSADVLSKLSPAGPLDEARRRFLEEALAAKTDAVRAGEGRVTAFSGQRVHVKDGVTAAYLRDYDAEVAQEAAISDPIPADVQEGTLIDVRPFLAPDGSIAVECRVRAASMLSMDVFDTGTPFIGTLQLPQVDNTSLRTVIALPPQGLALAGAWLLPAEHRQKSIRYECILVSATCLGQPSTPIPADGSKPIRVMDVGYLVNPYPDFPGPAVSLAFGAAGAPEGATFAMGGEEGVPIAGDLVALISEQVAPGTWTADHLLEPGAPGRIVARNSADVMKQLDRFLSELARPVGRSVSVEIRFLAIDMPTLAALSADTGPLARGTPALSQEQVTKLLARAQTEEGVREVGAASACGLAGRRFSLASLRTTAYVQDYDVEIATKSKIGDPVVGALTVGTVLDVRPQVSPDGKKILLDLRPIYAESAGPVTALDTRSGDVGKVQLPSVRSHQTRASLLVDDGGWFIMGLGGQGKPDTETVVVLVRAKSVLPR